MAKKRGGSPLGNAPGSLEAQKAAAAANLSSLTQQLARELEKTGQDASDYLADKFGLASVGQSTVWQLASGNTAVFNEVTLSFEQVKNDTVVTFDVNGRDQSLLTAESLQDLSSLAFQQFYPAVGHEVDGKVDILDGSRRRAWFLLQQGKVEQFRVLVTKDDISISDAKALAKQLQTAKEHSLREVGLQCVALKNANPELTQGDIAKQVGCSQAAVSKSMKAASIDEALVKLFPVVSDLSYPDYVLLEKVMKVCDDDKKLSIFCRNIQEKVVNILPEYSVKDRKDTIISTIKAELKIAESKQANDAAQVTVMKEFETKGVFARKRVKGRNFSYEFGRLPKSVQEKLDEAILKVLEEES